MTSIRKNNTVRDISPLHTSHTNVVKLYTQVCQLYKKGLTHKEIAIQVGKKPEATRCIISKCMKMGILTKR